MSSDIDQVATRARWFRGPSTLRARVFWSIMPIFIVFVTLSGAINIYLQRRSADEQFTRHGQRMTASLAAGIELGVFMEDTDQLIESITGAANDQTVAYVLIYGEQDRLLASVGRFVGELDSEKLQLSVEEMRGLVIDRLVLSRPARSAEQRFSEFVAPVTWVEGLDEEELIGSLAPAGDNAPRVIGYVRVGLSRSMLEKDSIALLKVFGVLTATFLMLSLVAIYFLSRRISRPLRQLTAYARQISQGDLDQQIPVTSRDDIGQLAANFNEMTLALKGNIESKEQLISQVQEFNHTLEERIAERTDELQRRSEALENANRYKSEFLANMSHELRTPLNAIIGYSEMLEEEAVDLGLEDSVADLRKIHGAGKHLLALINDILDLSKVEAGQMELFLERFDVKAMVEDVFGTIQPLAGKNHNELQVNCPGDFGEMCADMTRVRQCLFNLLSNACKFTENGKVTLDVCAVTRDALPQVMFCVTDTGIGISERQISRIFRAFGQADASTTRRFGGTGLGLAISLEYCHLMGGRIDVDSEPGEGSKFTIVLPLDVSAVIEQRDGEQGESEAVEQEEERGQGPGGLSI
jgi:signal transduction histidine kinase